MSDKLKKSINKSNDKQKNYIKLVFCGLAGSGLYFLLLSFLSFITLRMNLSDSLFMPLGIVFGIISGFFSGYTAARLFMQKGLFLGILSGLICLFFSSVFLFAVNGGKAGSGLIILSAVILASSAAGGIAAVAAKPKRKR